MYIAIFSFKVKHNMHQGKVAVQEHPWKEPDQVGCLTFVFSIRYIFADKPLLLLRVSLRCCKIFISLQIVSSNRVVVVVCVTVPYHFLSWLLRRRGKRKKGLEWKARSSSFVGRLRSVCGCGNCVFPSSTSSSITPFLSLSLCLPHWCVCVCMFYVWVFW